MLARSDTAINDAAPWSDDDSETLGALYAMEPRPPVEQISRVLGRSVRAIQARATWLQFAQRAYGGKMRGCITKGGRTFCSTHNGNRICPLCKRPALVRCA
jgi:hypothetical protein